MKNLLLFTASMQSDAYVYKPICSCCASWWRCLMSSYAWFLGYFWCVSSCTVPWLKVTFSILYTFIVPLFHLVLHVTFFPHTSTHLWSTVIDKLLLLYVTMKGFLIMMLSHEFSHCIWLPLKKGAQMHAWPFKGKHILNWWESPLWRKLELWNPSFSLKMVHMAKGWPRKHKLVPLTHDATNKQIHASWENHSPIHVNGWLSS